MSAVYKLNCSSRGHPKILRDSTPPSYFKDHFVGKPLPADWQPPPHEWTGLKSKLADALAWKESILLLSEQAASVFQGIAADCVEFCAFSKVRGQTYMALNVLNIEDVLDIQKYDPSEISKTGEVLTGKYFLRKNLVRRPIFKLPGNLMGPVFVTEVIAKIVVDHQLTGFQFREAKVNETAALFRGLEVNAFPGVLP